MGPQEINLFAQVALNPYGSSSACRLTLSSTGDLIWNPNLGVGFPLRCFQRLSQRNVATRRYCWRNNRHTRDSSREVLSYCPQLSSRFRRFHRIESDIIVLNYLNRSGVLGKPTIARRIRPYLPWFVFKVWRMACEDSLFRVFPADWLHRLDFHYILKNVVPIGYSSVSSK